MGRIPTSRAARLRMKMAAPVRKLDSGASADGKDPVGRTPLMFAAMFDREDIVRILLSRGADPAWRSASGETAASLAAAMGAVRALRALGVSG